RLFEEAVQDRTVRDRGRLAVEKVEAPLLLLSGQQDGVWPSSAFSELVCQRLKKVGQEFEVTHRTYAQAGHMLGPELGYPHRPTGCLMQDEPPCPGAPPGLYDLGGRPAHQAHAQRDSWNALLDFLGRHLKAR
ncbi:MAG: acyl-CoA thioester hydrolase/BAAT C-terminal domain-containing protein, partial [Candidatus Eremiobacterota bacterium]